MAMHAEKWQIVLFWTACWLHAGAEAVYRASQSRLSGHLASSRTIRRTMRERAGPLCRSSTHARRAVCRHHHSSAWMDGSGEVWDNNDGHGVLYLWQPTLEYLRLLTINLGKKSSALGTHNM
jgi:hypothetical protein